MVYGTSAHPQTHPLYLFNPTHFIPTEPPRPGLVFNRCDPVGKPQLSRVGKHLIPAAYITADYSEATQTTHTNWTRRLMLCI